MSVLRVLLGPPEPMETPAQLGPLVCQDPLDPLETL